MFEKPEVFWLFLLIPVIILLLIFDIIINKKRSKKIAGKNIKLIIPYYTEGQKWIKLVVYVIAFCLTILALARPKWGLTTIDSKIKGRDVLILLDVSYSMATNDIIPSRFDLAKSNIIDLLKSETGDRIGLMIFSGETELISPVTFDYAALNFFLDSLYPGMLGKGGTNIGKSLLNAIRSFDDEVVNNKMILLITDGENLQSDFNRALKKVKESKIKIFTIGVGTKNGQPIPIRDTEGKITTYVKDENGKHVISKLNEKLLRTIANETNGLFLGTITKQNLLTTAMSYIKNVEKKAQDTISFNQKKDRYNIFLIPALILFSLGFILDQGKLFKIKYNRFDWLFNKKIILFFLLFSFLFSPYKFYAEKNKKDKNIEYAKQKNTGWIGKPNGGFWGNILFKKNYFKKALESYFGAINILKSENLAKLNYNIANTFYKLNDLKNASQYYKNAVALTKDEKLKSKIFYNQALVEFKNQNYSYAAELFKEVVKIDDQDEDARYNYVICNELKKEAQNYYNRYVSQTLEENYNDNKNRINQDQQLTQQFSNNYIEKLLNALDEKEKKENHQRSLERKNQDIKRIKYW